MSSEHPRIINSFSVGKQCDMKDCFERVGRKVVIEVSSNPDDNVDVYVCTQHAKLPALDMLEQRRSKLCS